MIRITSLNVPLWATGTNTVYISLLRARLPQASLKWMETELLQNGVATRFGVTPFLSTSVVSLASLTCWLCVDTGAWCKWGLFERPHSSRDNIFHDVPDNCPHKFTPEDRWPRNGDFEVHVFYIQNIGGKYCTSLDHTAVLSHHYPHPLPPFPSPYIRNKIWKNE